MFKNSSKVIAAALAASKTPLRAKLPGVARHAGTAGSSSYSAVENPVFDARRFIPGVTTIVSALVGGGVLYLAQEVRKYNDLTQDMKEKFPLPPLVKHHRKEHSSEKEWLIIGRQSPGYALPHQDKKDTQKKQVDTSEIEIKTLGAVLDNESHYDLLPWSPFQIKLFSDNPDEKVVVIDPKHMLGLDLHQIPDSARFEIGIAHKPGFADIVGKDSPFAHLAMAFRLVSDDAKPVEGRVIVTGAEIKKVIKKTNANVCEKQHCDLYRSNCQSASTYGLAEFAKVIHKRAEPTGSETADIKIISGELHALAFDNLSRGVSNNDVVTHQLTYTLPKVLKERGIVALTPDVSSEAHEAPRI